MRDNIISGMFDEAVGKDLRNKQIANGPVRRTVTQVELGSYEAILGLL